MGIWDIEEEFVCLSCRPWKYVSFPTLDELEKHMDNEHPETIGWVTMSFTISAELTDESN